MPDRAPVAIPDDPRQWRPQTIYKGRHEPQIINPVVEPLWSGTRVIVHFREGATPQEWGTIEVLDQFGDDAMDEAPIALDYVRRSIRASEAVIDGIITTQATGGGEGMAVVLQGRTQPLKRMFIGGRSSDVTFEPPRDNRHEGDPAFVALDLLSIDGQRLFDVPLLERKRILEGAIEQSELVRTSPVVRPPLRQWFATWRSAGFRGLMLKSTNSHYEPGGETVEWAKIENMPRS